MTRLRTRFPLLFIAGSLIAAITLRGQESQLARVEIANAAQPQLAVAADGRVWLVYGHGVDILVAASEDGGVTFLNATKVASVPKLMLGMRRGPRIVAHGNELVVTAIAHELLAFRSQDAGRSWTGPTTINEVATSAREGLHDLAISPEGNPIVTWLDLRNGKMELWAAQSPDRGKTWGTNERVYASPDKSICECCHPTVRFDSSGTVAIMWRNLIGGSRDMWLTTRPHGGTQFSSAKKLGEGTWKLNACPMDGGTIVPLGNGTFASVWQREGEIFYASPSGPEAKVAKGKQPVAIARDTEILIVWQQGNDLVSALASHSTEPTKHAEHARHPVLVALPGKGAVLAYERGAIKGATSVIVERL